MGWPPIRSSFRKNTTVSGPKAAVVGSLFVKVSMDGAAYLRKVDLSMHYGYQGLTSALEEMFSCFTIGYRVFYAYSVSFYLSLLLPKYTIFILEKENLLPFN